RTASTTVVVNVFGVDQDNASNPTDATDANGRPLTSGVSWNINTTWTSGTLHDTPDISSIVDAIIGRAGWSSGNALMFYINHSSGSSAREVASFDRTTRAAPSLTIEYTGPAAGVNVEPLPAPFVLDSVTPGVIKGALSITPDFSAMAFFAQA